MTPAITPDIIHSKHQTLLPIGLQYLLPFPTKRRDYITPYIIAPTLHHFNNLAPLPPCIHKGHHRPLRHPFRAIQDITQTSAYFTRVFRSKFTELILGGAAHVSEAFTWIHPTTSTTFCDDSSPFYRLKYQKLQLRSNFSQSAIVSFSASLLLLGLPAHGWPEVNTTRRSGWLIFHSRLSHLTLQKKDFTKLIIHITYSRSILRNDSM